MATYQFDPRSVTVIFNGKVIHGFTDGTFLTFERDEDTWSKKSSCEGDVTRVKTNNYSGSLTLVLHQSSPSNDDLSAAANLDQANNGGAGPLLVRDGSGTTSINALSSWVRKPAAVEFGKELSERTWVIDTGACNIIVGGNQVTNA